MVDPSLTTLNLVNLPLDSTATLAVSQITSFTGGDVDISGGTLSLPVLTDIDGSTFQLSAGVSPQPAGGHRCHWLQLPGQRRSPAHVAGAGQLRRGRRLHRHLEATGSGSKLSLPALATIAGETTNYIPGHRSRR